MTTDSLDDAFRAAYRSKELLDARLDQTSERIGIVRDVFREFPPPQEGGDFMLVLRQGVGEWHPIADDTLVGSGEDCTLRVDRQGVSRHHFRISRSEDNSLIVTDLDSTNGTFVNEERITRKRLLSGDILLIGDTTLVCFIHTPTDA